MQIRQTFTFGQPLCQRFDVQELPGIPRILPFLIGDHHERMHVRPCMPAVAGQLVCGFLRYEAVGDESVEHALQRQEAVVGSDEGFGCHGCGTIDAGTNSLNDLHDVPLVEPSMGVS